MNQIIPSPHKPLAMLIGGLECWIVYAKYFGLVSNTTYLNCQVLTTCCPICESQNVFINLDYLTCFKIFLKIEMYFKQLEFVEIFLPC